MSDKDAGPPRASLITLGDVGIPELDGFECLGEITAIAAIPRRDERHRALAEFLTGRRFLGLISRFGYWRGNLFVVRGSDRADSHPIHWHWVRDPWSGKPRCLLDDPKEARIALPFVSLEDPLRLVSPEERRSVEGRLLTELFRGEKGDTTHRPTSTRLISRMRDGVGRDRFVQEVCWGELLEGLAQRDGRFPPADLEPTAEMVEAVVRYQPDLRPLDPGPAATAADLAAAIAAPLLRGVDQRAGEARFYPHTPRVERIRHIIGFLADSVHVDREIYSVYCVLELRKVPSDDERFEIMSIFGKVASISTLSDSLSNQAVRQSRSYLHSFSKPMRPLVDLIEQAAREADAAKRNVLLSRALRQIDWVHAQAESIRERHPRPKRIRLREGILEPLVGFVNDQFAAPVVELCGDEIDLELAEVYLKCLVINAISNAVENNPAGYVVRVAWQVGGSCEELVGRQISGATLPRAEEATEPGEVILWVAVHNMHNAPRNNLNVDGVGSTVIDDMASRLGGTARRFVTDTEYLLVVRIPRVPAEH